jgi:hypothetical protein
MDVDCTTTSYNLFSNLNKIRSTRGLESVSSRNNVHVEVEGEGGRSADLSNAESDHWLASIEESWLVDFSTRKGKNRYMSFTYPPC